MLLSHSCLLRKYHVVASEPGQSYQGLKKGFAVFLFLIYYYLVIVWDLVSTQLDCLPGKKNAEIFGP